MKNYFYKLLRLLMAASFFLFFLQTNAQPPAWSVNKAEPLYSDPVTNGVYDTDIKISVSLSIPGKVYYITYSIPPATNPSAENIIKYCRGTLALPPNVVKTDSIGIPVASTTYTATIENAPIQRDGYLTAMAATSESGTVNTTTKNLLTFLRTSPKKKSIYFYTEFLPSDYNNNSNQYPLIIFLHGAGERGNTIASLNSLLLSSGVPREANNRNGDNFPFIVIAPQTNSWEWDPVKVETFLNEVKASGLRIDLNRIYVTGLSMGGEGTWRYILTYPDKVTAAVPISGNTSGYEQYACRLAQTPLWTFHDDPDNSGYTPTSSTKSIVSKIKACPTYGGDIITTYYENKDATGAPIGKHSAWTRAYGNTPSPASTETLVVVETPEMPNSGYTIYDWFLEQSGIPNQAPLANAGNDVSVILPVNTASLTGSGSDPDGTIAAYAWTQVTGPNTATIQTSNAQNTGVTNLVQGVYTFRLTVTDDDGATGVDHVQVTVSTASAEWSLYIDSGGDSSTVDEKKWEKDKQTAPHQYYVATGGSLTTGSSSSFTGTNTTFAPNSTLGTYRYTSGNGNRTIKYSVPVPVNNADYRVHLFFARRNGETIATGVRKFNVNIEDVTETTLDIAEITATGAIAYSYTRTITDGFFDVSLVGVETAHSQINAIAFEKIATTDPPGIEPVTIAIDPGGLDFLSDSLTWEKDKQTAPHPFLDNSFASLTTGSTSSFTQPNTTGSPNEVLGTYRYTSGTKTTIRYVIDVPAPGNYNVQLFFAHRNGEVIASGARRFNIFIAGTDIGLFDVGDNTASGAVVVTHTAAVSDTTLEVKLIALTGANAQINGLKITGPIQANLSSGLNAVNSEQAAIGFYPNKVRDDLTIEGLNGPAEIQVHNAVGKPLFTKTLTEVNGTVIVNETRDLVPGIYIMIIRKGEYVQSYRFIKE